MSVNQASQNARKRKSINDLRNGPYGRSRPGAPVAPMTAAAAAAAGLNLGSFNSSASSSRRSSTSHDLGHLPDAPPPPPFNAAAAAAAIAGPKPLPPPRPAAAAAPVAKPVAKMLPPPPPAPPPMTYQETLARYRRATIAWSLANQSYHEKKIFAENWAKKLKFVKEHYESHHPTISQHEHHAREGAEKLEEQRIKLQRVEIEYGLASEALLEFAPGKNDGKEIAALREEVEELKRRSDAVGQERVSEVSKELVNVENRVSGLERQMGGIVGVKKEVDALRSGLHDQKKRGDSMKENLKALGTIYPEVKASVGRMQADVTRLDADLKLQQGETGTLRAIAEMIAEGADLDMVKAALGMPGGEGSEKMEEGA